MLGRLADWVESWTVLPPHDDAEGGPAYANDPHIEHAGTGRHGGTSFRTMWNSVPQRKVLLLALVWQAFYSGLYIVMANVLVYQTFHYISVRSPSSPGAPVLAGNDDPSGRAALFDLGFFLTPNWNHRPWLLKVLFVDLNVFFAQLVPASFLLLTGRTRSLTQYVGCVGLVVLGKSVVQLFTVLPPANGGGECWDANFAAAQLDTIRNAPFSSWFYQNWGAAHGCNDMIWSGHTAQSTLGFLFLNRKLQHYNFPVWCRALMIPYLLTYWFAVLACRMHYSVDVLSATLVAGGLYTHRAASNHIWWYANKLCRNPEGGAWTHLKSSPLT
mmetsp:Transcript_15770/g.46797  ORF Transcript_15770/g.46797 Transcript_15770/m.46797 type:complete len:328 (-) Transcript_15770:75-1058(-)